MKLFHIAKDGGPESHVWGYWLIELKRFFSIAVLRFEDGSRDAFHSHAFHCISWVLSGRLEEQLLDGRRFSYPAGLWPIFTGRTTFHRVKSVGRTWVLTFRGPWSSKWTEYLPSEDRFVDLTHGRKEVI